MPRNGVRAVTVAASVLLLVSGCVAAGPSNRPSTGPAPDTAGYTCDGRLVPRDARDDRVPIGDLGQDVRAALDEALQRDGMALDLSRAAGWYVVDQSPQRINILREVGAWAEPYGGGVIPDHEVFGVELVSAPNTPSGWHVWTHDFCALRLDLDPLVVPEITLESEPDPTSTELHLLVTEHGCNSGEDADGRIEVVRLEESDARVSVILGVRPRGGFVTCPGNPSTPFTVTLRDPLGNRELVDGSLADPRPLTVG